MNDGLRRQDLARYVVDPTWGWESRGSHACGWALVACEARLRGNPYGVRYEYINQSSIHSIIQSLSKCLQQQQEIALGYK